MQSSHNAANSFYCIVGGVIKASCAALMESVVSIRTKPIGEFQFTNVIWVQLCGNYKGGQLSSKYSTTN